MSVVLAAAVQRAASITDERTLADLRRDVDEEIDTAVHSPDFRVRAIAFRAIGQLRFAQKTEMLRRGLDDDSPACRGSALLSLELLSRTHPGPVNSVRPRLHTLANGDPNGAVRRLAVLCLKNGSATQDTMTLLAHIAEGEEDQEVARAAAAVLRALKQKAAAK